MTSIKTNNRIGKNWIAILYDHFLTDSLRWWKLSFISNSLLKFLAKFLILLPPLDLPNRLLKIIGYNNLFIVLIRLNSKPHSINSIICSLDHSHQFFLHFLFNFQLKMNSTGFHPRIISISIIIHISPIYHLFLFNHLA